MERAARPSLSLAILAFCPCFLITSGLARSATKPALLIKYYVLDILSIYSAINLSYITEARLQLGLEDRPTVQLLPLCLDGKRQAID